MKVVIINEKAREAMLRHGCRPSEFTQESVGYWSFELEEEVYYRLRKVSGADDEESMSEAIVVLASSMFGRA